MSRPAFSIRSRAAHLPTMDAAASSCATTAVRNPVELPRALLSGLGRGRAAEGARRQVRHSHCLGTHLLRFSDDERVALDSDDRVENVMFRSVLETPTGFPEESASLLAVRNESRLWEPQPAGDHVGAIVRTVSESPSRCGSPAIGRRDLRTWHGSSRPGGPPATPGSALRQLSAADRRTY